MKKSRKLFSGIMAFVMIMAVLVSPISDHLPIVGEGMKVSAAAMTSSEIQAKIDSMAAGDSGAAYKTGQTFKGSYAGKFTVTENGTKKTHWNSSGSQCLGFGKKAFEKIFEGKGTTAVQITYTGDYSDVEAMTDWVKNNAQPGDYMRFGDGGTHATAGYGHSVIIYSVSSSGIEVYDCNGYNSGNISNLIQLRLMKWGNKTTATTFKYKAVGTNKGGLYLIRHSSASGSGSEPPSYSVAITNTTGKNTFTDTNAIIWAQVDKPKSCAVTKIGVRVRADGSTYANGWSKYDDPSKPYTNSTYMYIYYDMNKELNLKLKPGTTYCYQFCAVVNGKEYWGTEGKFTTTNSVAIKNTTGKNTVTGTNAIIWAQVDKPKSYSVTKIGIRVRVDGGTYANGWSKYDNPSRNYTDSAYMYIYYDMNKELNLKLTRGTTYCYQFYAVVNGQEYWGPESKFTTA